MPWQPDGTPLALALDKSRASKDDDHSHAARDDYSGIDCRDCPPDGIEVAAVPETIDCSGGGKSRVSHAANQGETRECSSRSVPSAVAIH
jgi:hypothetical protein